MVESRRITYLGPVFARLAGLLSTLLLHLVVLQPPLGNVQRNLDAVLRTETAGCP